MLYIALQNCVIRYTVHASQHSLLTSLVHTRRTIVKDLSYVSLVKYVLSELVEAGRGSSSVNSELTLLAIHPFTWVRHILSLVIPF